MPNPTLSIVIGTLQRLPYLKHALTSARDAVGKLSHEFVIVDGGSTDGTLGWLREFANDRRTRGSVTVIEQGARLGAVKAFNAGFAAARGEFVAALNDDTCCVGPLFADAVQMLHKDKRIGQIALPYGLEKETPHYEQVNIPELGKVLYANFGVIPRTLGSKLGWWGDYYQYGGDTELSVKVWFQSLRVEPLRIYAPGQKLKENDPRLIHYLVDDDTRVPNIEQATFNARWRKMSAAPGTTTLADLRQRLEKVVPEGVPPLPRHMERATLLRFQGMGDGKHPYMPPLSNFRYLVSAPEPLVWVEEKDVAWMLGLRQRNLPLFVQVEIEPA